jgi:hypothetical protein
MIIFTDERFLYEERKKLHWQDPVLFDLVLPGWGCWNNQQLINQTQTGIAKTIKKSNKDIKHVRGIGFFHRLWPWKYQREGGAWTSEKYVNENWKCRLLYMQIDVIDVTNDDVFGSVCSAYLRAIAHEKIQHLYHCYR